MTNSNILIINPFGIGDVLFSTPLINSIKVKYPSSSISYICNARAYGVLKNNPLLSKIYIYEKDNYRSIWTRSKYECIKSVLQFLNNLKREKYDIVFDASLGYLTSLLMMYIGIKVRVGFNYKNRGRFLTHKLFIEGFHDKHAVEYYLDLGIIAGIEPLAKEISFYLSDDDKMWADQYLSKNVRPGDKLCAIIPGCGASWGKDARYRRLDTVKFAEVAKAMARKYNYKIIIFGEQSEKKICDDVLNSMRIPAIQACGATSLCQFAALIDKCDMVITNDGGPLHVASAFKKNIVAIFGPVDEKVYGPYPIRRNFITVTSKSSCRPCYKKFKYSKCNDLSCLNEITVEQILEAVDSLIRHP